MDSARDKITGEEAEELKLLNQVNKDNYEYPDMSCRAKLFPRA